MTILGKVQSYMAVGKPIIGAINGSCANFIINNGIGYACSSQDSIALSTIIEESNTEEFNAIGTRAKEKCSKVIFVSKFLDIINRLVGFKKDG